jgi:hypothetical protein
VISAPFKSFHSLERVKNGPPVNERFLAKARLYGFKYVLFGKVKIPRTDEDYDMQSEQRKKLTIAADMIELAYTELMLSIDDKASNGKVGTSLNHHLLLHWSH